jgi:membrane associated rhomboid family serine protease
MFPGMSYFDRLERRWRWLAFPGFLRFYALFHVLVFVLQLLRPDIQQLLEFDKAKIFSGEVWRVGTMFFANSEFGDARSPTGLIFLFFAVNFVFMIGDGLEGAWGSFKSSLFYYMGIITVLVANFAYPEYIPIPASGTVLYASAFLAFCTLFPKVEIRLFFVLPIPVRFLGMLVALGYIATALSDLRLLPFFLVAFANYFIWAGIPALRGTARLMEAGQRRRRFNASKISASEAFHTCVVCKKNDITDPHAEFRIGENGEEYCAEHLPE